MSSKILLPDDALPVTPMAWRTVSVKPDGTVSKSPDPPAAPKPSEADREREKAQAQERERQWEQRVREAHAAGVREGEAAGRGKAAAELQQVIERLAVSIEETAGLRARLRRDAENDMVRLALAIARKILFREVAVDADAMHGLVLGALEKLQAQEISRVRVHPSHVSLVTACLRQKVAAAPIEVVPDPSREPGAIIFETERGSLDASVDSQLREIERGLTDRLRNTR